jgi:hypothetical protein
MRRTRREFLADVGKGALIAGVGSGLAADLGLGAAWAGEPAEALTFGRLEPLVALMQETPPAKLQPLLVDKLKGGTDLGELVAAAALANARSFGGEDYVGFHTMMALAPAYHMAAELPTERRPLPVLKVLYRNSNRIQEHGGRKTEVLRPVEPGSLPEGRTGAELLHDAVHRKDMAAADRTFAALVRRSPEEALDQLLDVVEEQLEVHRVVLPYRAWALLPVVGREHAETLLRQSVHYCVKADNWGYNAGARALLPKVLDQHKLAGRTLGTRRPDDAWVESLSRTILGGGSEQAAGAVAEALAEGTAPDAVAEAISLATNQLVLRDMGRPAGQTAPNKPVGSVHGDGIGVHACDSANAWRNLARVGIPRQTVACLILSACQAAYNRTDRGGDFLHWEPYPRGDVRAMVGDMGPDGLLLEAESAIRNKDQALTTAAVHRYGELGGPPRPVLDLLLKYACSEDGALHAEKYYRTTSEEFAATRPAFRWRQLVALARVTASEYGQSAPGYADACRLLGV